ncbi:MAG: STAS domain-containing protein [bacterium]|nr:STAS domain-containing protein [bacterium]
MNIRVYLQDEVAVVKPEQNALYASQKEELNAEIQKLIESGTSKVVLDLDGVQWLDSATLGILTAALKLTKDAGGDLRLAGVNKRLTNVFVVTRLEELFQFFDTADEGVASFSADS